MSQVDLTTNGAAITDALNKVRSGKDIDWLLIGYEGKTNTLNVTGTGKGGLDELEEEFNDGKIEFAFIRVVDENTQLPKFVMISWCGEGVPEIKKGSLPLHTQAVEKLMKGFHVHINARSNKDVDKATVMKKVRDSSGANYSFHKEQKSAVADKPQPVGSNYQKPEIMGRSKAVNASVFTQPANDDSEKKRIIEERKRQEEEERKRVQDQEQEKEAEQKQARVQASAQAQAQAQSSAQAEAKKREQEEAERQRRAKAEAEAQEAERQRAAAAAAPVSSKPAAGGFTATAVYEYAAAESNEISFNAGDVITGIEIIDEGWWQGYDPNGNFGLFPATYVQRDGEGGATPAPTPAASDSFAAPPVAESKTAVATYEYQANEENELSFAEGELITDIEFVDENWWQGKNASGYFGMFPASYVSLQ